jgi:thiol-disulfide isomerase/thioredoxin
LSSAETMQQPQRFARPFSVAILARAILAQARPPAYCYCQEGVRRSLRLNSAMVDTHYFVNGRAATSADFAGKSEAAAAFSWSGLLGGRLVTGGGTTVSTDDVVQGKRQVALFFGGSWCPWCRALTPLLEDTIRKVAAADADDSQVIYIPADADLEAFNAYMAGWVPEGSLAGLFWRHEMAL